MLAGPREARTLLQVQILPTRSDIPVCLRRYSDPCSESPSWGTSNGSPSRAWSRCPPPAGSRMRARRGRAPVAGAALPRVSSPSSRDPVTCSSRSVRTRSADRAREELVADGVRVYAETRPQATRQAVCLIDPSGERTITTLGPRLQARGSDPLPWDRLGEADAVYVTAGDEEAIRRARAAPDHGRVDAAPRNAGGIRGPGGRGGRERSRSRRAIRARAAWRTLRPVSSS